MKSKVKAYAKINLSLNVYESVGGYHDLDSIVTTIDLYDVITATKRRDDKIVVKMRGIGEDVLSGSNNNAYKAAVLFKETFNTKGMDITVTKHIPLGGGLGGSSADVAGVLNALKKLYDVADDVKPLADRLGSDSGYLLTGGFARLGGRGEKVTKIDSEADFYVVLVYSGGGVNTAECFKLYDQMKTDKKPSDNQKLEEAIKVGDIKAIASEVGNDLSIPAQRLCEDVEKNLNAIKALSPLCASVSGSGATVFGIFETKELSLWACDKLLKQGYDAEVVKTFNY